MRFTVHQVLGLGSFGVVCLAWDKDREAWVAIKRVATPKHCRQEESDRALMMEALISTRLEHENILTTANVLYTPGKRSMFLVMEPMDSSLFQAMTALSEGELMPVPRVKMVMRQVMRGLQHMHASGVIHRDIKPENVLLKEDVVKLADFGLACITCDPLECTRKCGTFDYMAPEMHTKGMYTPAVDVWAAGCILLELALGHISGKPLPPGVPPGLSLPSFFSTFTPEQLAQLKLDTPTEYSDIMDLLSLLLCPDPKSRISATDALLHPCLVAEDDMVVSRHTTGISLPHIKLLQMQFSDCSQHAQALEEHMSCVGLTVPLQ